MNVELIEEKASEAGAELNCDNVLFFMMNSMNL